MLVERRHGDAATRQSQRIQSTHGGFDGPYGTKVKTVWTQEEEGRPREGQASKRAHRDEGKEGQTRRKAQSHAQSAARAQEDGAQGAGRDKHGDTVDGDTPCDIARGSKAGGADESAAAAAGSPAAATASALAWRVDSFLDAILGAEAFGELVIDEHAAEAARQQLERRIGRRLVELLAPDVGPSHDQALPPQRGRAGMGDANRAMIGRIDHQNGI